MNSGHWFWQVFQPQFRRTQEELVYMPAIILAARKWCHCQSPQCTLHSHSCHQGLWEAGIPCKRTPFPLPGLCWTERCLCCQLCCTDSVNLRSPGIYFCSSISLHCLVGDYLLLCCCKFTTLLLQLGVLGLCSSLLGGQCHCPGVWMSRFSSHSLKSLAPQSCRLVNK